MYHNYKLGIVVPAYNEARLITRTLESMPLYADRIYVIDDGSTDCTRQVIEGFNGNRFHIVSNQSNQGVGAAIVKGYKIALEENVDIIAVMDGDNQMDSEYLPSLLAPIIAGKADYTKGDRLSKLSLSKGMSKWRLFGNWVLTVLTKIASGYWNVKDPQNCYTAITSKVLRQIDLNKVYPRYGYCNDLLAKLNVTGCRVVNVPIPARYGLEKSKIRYRKYIYTVSNLLLRCFLWRLRMKYFTPRLKTGERCESEEGTL